MVVVVVVTGWYLHWCGSLWAFQSRHLFIILTSVLSIKEYWDILPLQWSVLTPSVLLTRPVQTVKDDTAYTQVSNKPDETPEAPANQPMRNGSYIAMSPVEAQKCWSRIPSPSVELRKGAEGAAGGFMSACLSVSNVSPPQAPETTPHTVPMKPLTLLVC